MGAKNSGGRTILPPGRMISIDARDGWLARAPSRTARTGTGVFLPTENLIFSERFISHRSFIVVLDVAELRRHVSLSGAHATMKWHTKTC